jgi:predicted HD superfamily hydrolase involved in NAD metabolism
MDIQLIQNTLTTLISQNRYEHSVRVAELMFQLAQKYGVNPNKAYLAGLIHDCAKEMSPTSSAVCFDDQEIALYETFPEVWHAFVVKAVGIHYFGTISEDVLDSAMYHTTGKANMNVFQKIMFVADFLEPGRRLDGRKHVDVALKISLDKAVFEISVFKLQDLLNQKRSIHSNLFDCYNFYNQGS